MYANCIIIITVHPSFIIFFRKELHPGVSFRIAHRVHPSIYSNPSISSHYPLNFYRPSTLPLSPALPSPSSLSPSPIC